MTTNFYCMTIRGGYHSVIYIQGMHGIKIELFRVNPSLYALNICILGKTIIICPKKPYLDLCPNKNDLRVNFAAKT